MRKLPDEMSTRGQRREPPTIPPPRRAKPPALPLDMDEVTPVDALLDHEKRATNIMLGLAQMAERLELVAERIEPFAASWKFVPLFMGGCCAMMTLLVVEVAFGLVRLLGR